METQNTLGGAVSYSGIALHTGARAHLTMKAAPENTGIVFRRIDLPGAPSVRAIASNVVDVRRGTTIASGDARVYTVEHVLAALHASKIDNAFVEMDGFEPPIADGSAKPYLEMIKEAGTVSQLEPARYIAPSETIVIEERDTQMVFIPAEGPLHITCTVSFGATPLDTQFLSCTLGAEYFERDLAPARTFVQFRELEQLLTMGLVKGGSLDNAVILHSGAIICKDGQRYSNELVRHKVLDIIGDLFLCGARVGGHLIAVKPGHPTNVQLAQKLIAQNCGKA
ncbi:MAG: UDP-3-O-[3-hydroxymyristoyl] N-acetylglucosamine deacetylase [Lentisphaerae bacterium GWF2_45_14]|nr:MAG: UDP-3-O-[3-hydroxymyristoyl] N-acetylglucosamine deacetylase [Lentisphaerae bacterium GWF2_45_14]